MVSFLRAKFEFMAFSKGMVVTVTGYQIGKVASDR